MRQKLTEWAAVVAFGIMLGLLVAEFLTGFDPFYN
jgi:hypothetical protein